MPSIIDFKSYKPTFIGKPVDELATMMKSTAERQQRVYDTTSTMDMMLSETSENLESSELYRVDEARTKIKESLGELANATDHRTSDVKLNKMVLGLNTDKGLNAAMTKSANYKKWGDDANKRVTDGNLNRSVYESIREKSKYEPVKADKFGYYDTRVENNYQTALEGGNTAGYNFAPIVDFNELLKDGSSNLQNIYGGTPTVVYVKDPKTGQNIRMIKIKRTGVSGGIAGSDNGEDLISVEEYSNSLKSILDNDPAAVNYMQDIALAKGNTPEEVAKDIATAYAINHSAVQNMDRYVNAPLPKIKETLIPEIDLKEVTESVGFKQNMKHISKLATKKSDIDATIIDKTVDVIGDVISNVIGWSNETYTDIKNSILKSFGGDPDIPSKSNTGIDANIESEYGYIGGSTEDKITLNNMSNYMYGINMDELYTDRKDKIFTFKGVKDSNGNTLHFNYKEAENFIFEGIKRYTDFYDNDEQVSAYTENIPDFTIKSINDKYKGGRALLQYLIGGNTIKNPSGNNAFVTGVFKDRYYYIEGMPKALSGEKFKTEFLDKLPDGTPLSINNFYNYKNPYVAKTGNKEFSKSFDMDCGGQRVIVSMAKGLDSIGDFNTEESIKLSDYHALQYTTPLKPKWEGLDNKSNNIARIVYDKRENNGKGGYVINYYSKNKSGKYDQMNTEKVSTAINVSNAIQIRMKLIEDSKENPNKVYNLK